MDTTPNGSIDAPVLKAPNLPTCESIIMRRRSFLTTATTVGTVAYLNQRSLFAAEKTKRKKRATILFQGDSITDAGRNKKAPVANEKLGLGYPNPAAKLLPEAHPQLRPHRFTLAASPDSKVH